MNKNKPTPEYLTWLTNRRNESQRQNAQLLKLLLQYPQKWNDQEKIGRPAQYLTAVCFSLWRAVFLGHTKEDTPAALSKATEFLQSIVLTNNIGFMQDWNASDWTFGYYVNSAYFRLNELHTEWPKLFDDVKPTDKPVVRQDFDRYQAATRNDIVALGRLIKATRKRP